MRTIKEEVLEVIGRAMAEEEKKAIESIKELEKKMFKKPVVFSEKEPLKFEVNRIKQ